MLNGSKVGLFITSAQPGLHKGHLSVIQQAIDNEGLSEVIIGINCSNRKYTSINPFTADERKSLVDMTIKGIKNCKCSQIFLIPDFGDDEKWLKYIFENLPKFDYIISGDFGVLELMKKKGIKVARFRATGEVRGSTIRELIARDLMGRVEDFLSLDVVSYLKEIGAPARMKSYFQKDMKNPSLAVDVVVLTIDGKIVLIKRKNPPYGVALPGGFVDIGETLIDAAKRESMEEISVSVKIEKNDYLGYWDNPDRDPRAHVITHAFRGKIIKGNPKAADDAKEIIIIRPEEIDSLSFAFPDHKEMIMKALSL